MKRGIASRLAAHTLHHYFTRKPLLEFLLIAGWFLLRLPAAVAAQDDGSQAMWTTFRADPSRSGRSAQVLPVAQLRLAWQWQSPTLPNPAWDGPARWDAYNQIHDLPAMRQYDACFHPVSDGRRVFFGSSSNDTLYAMDLATGRLMWRFVAGGPIRLSPSLGWNQSPRDLEQGAEEAAPDNASAPRVYFGCDDGWAYCLDGDSGQLIWRFNPAEFLGLNQRHLLHNQRLGSPYPIRSGISLGDGRAYFAASFLPWQPSLLCAVDQETGHVGEVPGTYVTQHAEATLEGAMLIADQRLIVPQGRVAPMIFDRQTGESQGSLPGGGGVTMVLSDQGDLARTEGGRSARAGQMGVFRGRQRVASFPRGRSMIITDDHFFVIDGDKLFAASRQDQVLLWQRELDQPVELIMAGDDLIVGEQDRVTVISAADGQPLWSHPIAGRGHGLALANGHLIVATDLGQLSVFHADAAPPPTTAAPAPLTTDPNNNLAGNQDGQRDNYQSDNRDGEGTGQSATQPKERSAEATRPSPPGSQPVVRPDFLSWGPMLRYLEPGVAEVSYGTTLPLPSHVVLQPGEDQREFLDFVNKIEHRIRIDGLPLRRVARYQILGVVADGKQAVADYQIDTHFNWTLPAPAEADAGIRDLLNEAVHQAGIAVVWGQQRAELALALARQSRFHVILWVDSEQEAMRWRQRWAELPVEDAGLALSVTALPLELWPAAMATVVVADPEQRRLRRLVRPAGGIIHDGQQVVWRRAPLPGAGQWSHMYGLADNSAFGGEQLGQASTGQDLQAQWVGRPGPRYQTDRQNRKPAPLAVDGRLYLQGQQRLLALDAYSGVILWSLETPTVIRWNVPHDCSNWCADQAGVYVATDDQVWLLDGPSGQRVRHYELPRQATADLPQPAWGYVARVGAHLLGTATDRTAQDSIWWGPEKWYDSTTGPDSHLVAGQALFNLSAADGQLQWNHAGRVLHPTITVSGDAVYFVEDRTVSPDDASGQDTWRVPIGANRSLTLVCLDLDSGQTRWEQNLAPFPVHVSCLYLAAGGPPGQSQLVLAASLAEDRQCFWVLATDLHNGRPVWSRTVDWESNHHGKHLMRPAIEGELLYLRPEVMDLRTGQTIHRGFPSGHGCASYVLSTQGLFSRLGETTWWNVRKNETHRFQRLRTDCWISTVPAQGMLLMAEGGGGCSCGSWLETSIGFLPQSFDSWEVDDEPQP